MKTASFQDSPDPHFVDYYKRALYNHILGSQEPESDHGIQYEQAETGTNKDRHKVSILLNNEKLTVEPTISETDKDGFITLSYLLPQKLNTGSYPIRFSPDGTEWTPAIYEVRLLK